MFVYLCLVNPKTHFYSEYILLSERMYESISVIITLRGKLVEFVVWTYNYYSSKNYDTE